MRFDNQFLDAVIAFMPQNFVPPPPITVETENGQIVQTGRSYPCVVCGVRTGWRGVVEDCPAFPVCSDGCLKVFLSDSVVKEAVQLVEGSTNE